MNITERQFHALRFAACVLILQSICVHLEAQGLQQVKSDYTKFEYHIPMRDGVRLFTSFYVPKDSSHPYPILLSRTPYGVGPYGADQYKENLSPSPLFAKELYIFAYQDVRGRWMSEGTFEHVRPHASEKPSGASKIEINESTDTYDTIEWLLKNISGHNGRVGLWGISYPGFYAAAGMIDSHPALKAVSPQAPVSDWFASDDWHHNGALLLSHAFRWFTGNGYTFQKPTTVSPAKAIDRGTEDGYEYFMRLGSMRDINQTYFKDEVPFWTEIMRRETRDDWWKARNIRQHLRNIKAAVMTVGGWFDAENLFGALEVYRAVENQNPGIFNMLVMGPWIHGGWSSGKGDTLGDVHFDTPTAEYYREQIELAFFNYFLKDKGKPELPEAFVFETGTNRWHKFASWPPKETVFKTLFLQNGGRLSFDAPARTEGSGYDEYVSDPQKPVPFLPGISANMAVRYMVDDQRFAARRPDVLVYQTEPLSEDLTLIGPLYPTLHVSTTGTDADWIVKLIDVYPDRFPDEKGDVINTLGGYQQMVRGEVMRGKFRRSLEKPEPFIPGKVDRVEFTMPDTFHTFRRDHRLMVQIQSSWFPLINVNPQKFLNINEAAAIDYQKATQRVYRTAATPSQLRIGVLPQRLPNPS